MQKSDDLKQLVGLLKKKRNKIILKKIIFSFKIFIFHLYLFILLPEINYCHYVNRQILYNNLNRLIIK